RRFPEGWGGRWSVGGRAGGDGAPGGHFTAPMDRPRTSWRWAIQPTTTMGSDAMTAAADSWATNSPSLVMNPVRKTGTVAAWEAVRFTAKKNSFQEKIMQISAVAAMPGAMIGSITDHRIRSSPAPSTRAASTMATGTSRKNERSIHTAIGRFIAV